ncbi:hypothetical protein, partial [Isoptericola croceus]|uniref:hypothetical protein n=1 Tax=Isoptericola croceus TaxID=3031406 RepID=UPI0023F91C29
SDPRATFSDAEIATLAMPSSALHVLVEDGFAYIANGAQGVQIADVRVSANPVIENTVNGIGAADELFLDGRYLLVDVGVLGLSVIDVAAPL